MRLLELFCGTGSIGRAFERRGFEVISVDIAPKAKATHTCDIMQFDYRQYPPGYFDVVWGESSVHHVLPREDHRRPSGPRWGRSSRC